MNHPSLVAEFRRAFRAADLAVLKHDPAALEDVCDHRRVKAKTSEAAERLRRLADELHELAVAWGRPSL